jgi:ribosomal protein S18 acetylase RimI-like enzyme
MEVRTADAGDAAVLAQLEVDARTALLDARGGAALLGEQPAVADWSAVLADRAQRVLVAEIDGVVLGYLHLLLAEGRRGVVHQVYVDPGARELGFGSEMLDLAIVEAVHAGCAVIEGTALPGDRDTKNLYERAGITARKLIVSRPLTGR